MTESASQHFRGRFLLDVVNRSKWAEETSSKIEHYSQSNAIHVDGSNNLNQFCIENNY